MATPLSNGAPTPPPRLGKKRIESLVSLMKNREVGVLYSEKHLQNSQLAGQIAAYLRTIDTRMTIQTHLIRYEQNWVETAKDLGVTLFIFLAMSPLKAKKRVSITVGRRGSGLGFNPEEEYMSKLNRKLTDVVVLLSSMPSSKAEQRDRQARNGNHYLDRFLHLDINLPCEWLAEAALALFTAPQPKACVDDFAYWSQDPKLVEVWREEKTSLGLSIMTREMARESHFERIVLIKGFNDQCLRELPDRLGKYTHIQAVNGIFLDGLPIEKVTEVFRDLVHPHVQLLVRYIHPIRRLSDTPTPLVHFPERHSTYNPQTAGRRPSRQSIDTNAEPLPIPLFILGDHFTVCNTLFRLLQADDLQSPSARSESTSSLSSFDPTPTSPTPHPLVPTTIQENSDVSTPLKSTPVKDPLRRLGRHHGDLLANSDTYVMRAKVPPGKFEIDAKDLPDLTIDGKDADPETPHRPPQNLLRQVSQHHVPVAQREYILHMFTQKVDRQFAHLFLKPSGIYLIVVALHDILDDPLIQYENLFNWLRLIHTHVRPDEIRRVIVVGMYKKSQVQRNGDILKCVQHLNTAIRDQTKQTFVIPMKERGHVFMFDVDQAQTEVQYLCSCIRSCMDVFINRSWYFERQFFDCVFTPFNGFRNVCSKIMVKRGTVESSSFIQKLYDGTELPNWYFETLAAYAPAFISLSGGDCIIKPAFIADLLQTCLGKMTPNEYMVFAPSNAALCKLPVVTSQLLHHRMSDMNLEGRKQDAVISWMKELEVIYSIGNERSDIFFVPFLATEAVSDQAMFDWNEGVAMEFDTALTLYAQLHVPATEQFFHRLIALLLKDAAAMGPRVWVNLGCKEAMLPLHYDEPKSQQRQQLGVALLRYHPIQNIIEFRLRTSRPLLLLKAAQAKLNEVYGHSKYNESFKEAVSFHIPAPNFDPSIKESAIWKLGNVGVKPKVVVNPSSFDCEPEREMEDDLDEDDLGVDRPDKVLIKMRSLTTPGTLDTAELKTWASSDPEMKVLPANLYLYLQKLLSTGEHWAMVGSQLGLLSVEDINFYRDNPCNGGNGSVPLDRWKESTLTYKDLADVLKSQEVGLIKAANSVENFFSGDKTDFVFRVHSSRP